MSILMSDINKVLGLPQPTKKPSTLKKLRDPPTPRYIDKSRAIAIARQLKLEKIGKVSLRVSDKSGLSEIHKMTDTSAKILSRRIIIDQTKGLQTAAITKDSAVGKCILGPNKYHNRRLANNIDKIVEDQEKRRSLLSRKTREFKHHKVRGASDVQQLKQSPPEVVLPSISTSSDDPNGNGRRSKSPGYMRPRSCDGTRYTDTSVAEAEQFLNSNVIRATLDAPDNRSTSRAIDLVVASNTEYRPKSATELAAAADEVLDQTNTGSGAEDDPSKVDESNESSSKKPKLRQLTPPSNAFASAGIALLQNKYTHETESKNKLPDDNSLSPDAKTQNVTDGIMDKASPLSQQEKGSKSSGMLPSDARHVVDTENTNESAQSPLQPGNKGASGLGETTSDDNDIKDDSIVSNADTTSISKHKLGPSKGKIKLSKVKQPLNFMARAKTSSFMETILDESPRSTPTGIKSPRLQGIVNKSILSRMSTSTPVANDKDEDHKDSATDGRTTPRSSTMNLHRVASIAGQMMQFKNASRKRRRKKNVAFSKSTRDAPLHTPPGYKVVADPRFLNLQSSLIPDSANARHLYDAMGTVNVPDKPINRSQEGQGRKSSVMYSRKSENLAQFEELFGKCSF